MKKSLFKIVLCTTIVGGAIALIPTKNILSTNAYGNYWDSKLNTYYDVISTATKTTDGIETKYSLRETSHYTYPVLTANIYWYDIAGEKHPLENHKAYFNWGNFQLDLQTDSYGYVVKKLSTNDDKQFGIQIRPENEAATIVGGNYIYNTEGYYLKNNQWLHLDINIHCQDSDLAKSFEISEIARVSRNYVYAMSGDTLEPIQITFPYNNHLNDDGEAVSYHKSKKLYITTEAAFNRVWHTVGHEYGHYIEYVKDLVESPGGSHYYGKELIEKKGSAEKAMSFAYNEGLASYLGYAAQAYDGRFTSALTDYGDGDVYKNCYSFASDFDEDSTKIFLIELTDGIEPGIDNIELGYKRVWDAINTIEGKPELKNINKCIKRLLELYPQEEDNINELLGLNSFSSWFYNEDDMNLCAKYDGELKIYWRDVYDDEFTRTHTLIFVGNNNSQYSIDIGNGITYTLTKDQLEKVMDLPGNSIKCKIRSTLIGYYNNALVYDSKYVCLEKPNPIVVSIGTEGNNHRIRRDDALWYKFIPQENGLYKIKTNTLNGFKTKGELLNKIGVADKDKIQLNSYIENTDGSFEMKVKLDAYVPVYIKVGAKYRTSYDYGDVKLEIAKEQHICSYTHSYDSMSTAKHWANCACGNRKLEPHSFQTVRINGRPVKICDDCGFIADFAKDIILY